MWFEKAKFGSVFRVCVPCVRLGKKCINLLLVSVITNSEKHNSEHLPSSSYQIKTKPKPQKMPYMEPARWLSW